MIYLYGYLGVGVAVLAIILGVDRLTKEPASKSLREIFDAVNPKRKKLAYRILNQFVAPTIAAVAVVIWPVAVYMRGKKMLSTQEASAPGAPAPQEEREFAVTRAHLHEPLTVPQIEAREAVADPLGAVPKLPFGHLNAAWKIFIEGVAADDELWSFTAPWQTAWGRKEIRAGYVVVRGGVPANHFVTLWKDLEDDPVDGKARHAIGADGAPLLRWPEGFG